MPRLAIQPCTGCHSRLSFKESALSDLLARIQSSLTVRSRVGRELIIVGVALLLGLVAVPLAVWFVGNRILGPYTHGANPNAGPMALLGDFFSGLARGSLPHLIVAVGPLVIILLVRGAWALIRPKPRIKSNPRIEPTVAKDRL
jgi:hypothetical protein